MSAKKNTTGLVCLSVTGPESTCYACARGVGVSPTGVQCALV